VVLLHAIVGTLVPVFLCCMLCGFYGDKPGLAGFADGLKIWPFAIFAALAMVVPSVLVNYFLTFELTSLLGGAIGVRSLQAWADRIVAGRQTEAVTSPT
jgi:lactate permease